ncbi:MAG: C13 family peptidase [Pseudomonadota bacterium]
MPRTGYRPGRATLARLLAAGAVALLTATGAAAQTLNLIDRTSACQSSPLLGLSHNADPPGTAFVVQSADGFRVPDGPAWRLDQLRVRGSFNGSELEPEGADVRVYQNSETQNAPDAQVCSFNVALSQLGPQASSGNFEINLPQEPASACELPAGRYWVSVVFNGSVGGNPLLGRYWYWDQSTNASMVSWRMRATADLDGSGISCPDWLPRDQCSSVTQENSLCFGLSGNTKVTLRNSLADQFTSAGTSFLMDVGSAFADPDGDVLNFQANGLPDSLTLDPVSGRISGTLQQTDIPGSPYTVDVSVSDEDGETALDTFSLVVADNEVSEFRFRRLWPVLQQPWYFGSGAPDVAFAGEALFVANADFSRIQRFTPLGLLISNLFIEGPGGAGTVGKPRVIAASRKAVYTVGDLDPQVHMLDPEGTLIRKFGATELGGQVPQFLAITERGCRRLGGCVYVGLPDRVLKFSEQGQFLASFGSCSSAPCGGGTVQILGGLGASEDGFVYLADAAEDQLIVLRAQPGDAISTPPTFLTEVGSSGTDPGQFQQPGDLTLDRQGRVYVADANRVQVFDELGAVLDEYQANDPARTIRRLEFGPGNLGFASNDLAQVVRFRRVGDVEAGASTLNLSTPYSSADDAPGFFRQPVDLAAGPNSNMYIADAGNFRVQKFSPQGDLQNGFGSEGTGPGEFSRMIALDAGTAFGQFRVSVLDDTGTEYRIQRFDNQLNFVDQITLPSGADYVDMVIGSGGNAFLVTDQGSALKVAPDGTVLAGWQSEGSGGEFRQVAIAPNGLIYFTVQSPSQDGFEIFDRFGNFVAFLPAAFNAPASLTIATDGKIVLGEIPDVAPDVPRIKIFRQDGVLLQSVGEYGYFPGSFAAPSGLDFAPNGLLYITDRANNNVQVLDPVPPSQVTKVIVVAGGGPYAGNNLWETTQALTNSAYLALAYQGLSGDEIMYLSSNQNEDLDGNGVSDVDAPATPGALNNAITGWGADADQLVVYLADHGSEDVFRLNPRNTLSASQLASALDTAQAGPDGVSQAVVIYEACRAGSFVDDLANSSVNRIVLASTGEAQSAKFVSDGILSFSNQFWTQIFSGSDLADAYGTASQVMTASFSDQQPEADADGDGSSNEPVEDLAALAGVFVGAGTDFDPGSPIITSVTAPQTLASGNTAQISAFGVSDADGVSRVYAEIIPPDFVDVDIDQPVREFPGFELQPDSRGSVDYTLIYDDFSIEGVYVINVYAQDRFGNISSPSTTTVTVGNPELRKALLIVGGETTDPRWSAYSANGSFAFTALSAQGYSDLGLETVRYLSNGGGEGVDGAASSANVADAFAWAGTQAQDVVVYLVGGVRSGALRLASGDRLTVSELADYLDNLEAAISGRLVVLYDGNRSGAFLPRLASASDDRRLLITSAAASQDASFLLDGTLSFSQFFWNRVLNGDSVLEAFEAARDAISFSAGGQTPQLDDNSNGEGNDAEDGLLASAYSIGTGILQDANGPTVGETGPDVVLSGGVTTADIIVSDVLSTGSVDQVFGVVTTPPPQQLTDSFTFAPTNVDADGNGEYTGTYGGFGPLPGGGFAAGDYSISVYARDARGNVSFQENLRVEQTAGPDGYEPDATRAAASVIFVDDPDAQPHTFHVDSDADVMSFTAVNSPAGPGNPAQTYQIEVTEIDDFSGAAFNLRIELFGPTTPLGTPLATTSGGLSGSLSLTWPPANAAYDEGEGEYFVRVSALSSTQRGKYEVRVFRPDVLLTGLVRGSVVDAQTGLPVVGALISTGGTVAAASNPLGEFQLVENPGSYDLTVIPPAGYDGLVEAAVPVVESLTTWRLLQLDPSGVAPTVFTGTADNIGQTSVTLGGQVSPNGETTSVLFSVQPAAGGIVQPDDLAAGAPLSDVSAEVSGLTCETGYQFRVSATNASGTSDGNLVAFTTADCVTPPTVGTPQAQSITDSSATLTAQVDPMGSSTTTAFRWRPVGGVFNVYTDSSTVLTGNGSQTATLDVADLICGTNYDLQARASNSGGMVESALASFATAACPQPPPVVTTLAAQGITETSADLRAAVDPNGASTLVEYFFAAVGEADGPWLTATTITESTTVVAPVSGLDCGRSYRYRFRASNAGGQTEGAELSFMTAECPADFPETTSVAATAVSQTSATLNATVNPNESETQVSFDFGRGGVFTDSAALDVTLDGSDTQPVSVVLTGLVCNSEYQFRVQATNAAGTAFGAALTFMTNPCDRILLVDDDNNVPDVLHTYSGALDTLGFAFDVWNTNGADAEPGQAELESYSTVIWFTGNNADVGTGPSSTSEEALGAYLNSGGCLAVSAQDYFTVRANGGVPTPLMTDYLGVSGGTSDAGPAEVAGVSVEFAGLPASGTYVLDYAGAALQDRADELAGDSTAAASFSGEGRTAGLQKLTPAYRTLYLGFPLAAVPDATEQAAVLSAMLDLCRGADQIYADGFEDE